ncbi:glycosyltransferase [Kribbella sp. HUAS MG21]|uniref:Glycosyltransferase n=1 Tax=Kribbella sp. HUAS MG21 TaxID=3160966 RepID=A0AAU7TF70_9ACTN
MKIALLAHGTRGDVQPALAIGSVLQRRGHSVRLCVNADLAGWSARTGVPVTSSALDVGRFLNSAEAREILARGRISTLVRRVTADERKADASIAQSVAEVAADADLILSSLGMALRGAALHEVTGRPAASLLCAPMTPTAAWASLAGPVRDFRFGPLNRLTFAAFDNLLWRQSKPSIGRLCQELGVPPIDRPLRIGALPAVHAYSPRLVPRPGDWGPEQHVVGPALPGMELRAVLGESVVPEDLLAWLTAGEPPVYFGFGSLPVPDPRGLLDDIVAVAGQLGVRALIASGWTDYGVAPGKLADNVFLVGAELNHDEVLPRCRAAVHHGGSGTTAAVTRAGIPSVIVSLFLDQPFWAWRLRRLGLGIELPYRSLNHTRLLRAVREALTTQYVAKARAFGDVLRTENGAEQAAAVIDRWAESPAPRAPHRRAQP